MFQLLLLCTAAAMRTERMEDAEFLHEQLAVNETGSLRCQRF